MESLCRLTGLAAPPANFFVNRGLVPALPPVAVLAIWRFVERRELGDKAAAMIVASPAAGPTRANLAAGSAVAVTVLSWGAAFPLIRVGMRDLGPLELASARFVVAGALVLIWLAIRRPPLPSRGDAARFLICGLIGISVYNGLLNQGERTISAGAAAFIVNVAPILTAILATIFLRERFTPWGWAGALISFAGVGLIALGQPGGLAFGGGAVLVAGAALCTAIYFVIQRPLVARYGPLACTAYTLLAGALFLLPFLPGALPKISRAKRRAAGGDGRRARRLSRRDRLCGVDLRARPLRSRARRQFPLPRAADRGAVRLRRARRDDGRPDPNRRGGGDWRRGDRQHARAATRLSGPAQAA